MVIKIVIKDYDYFILVGFKNTWQKWNKFAFDLKKKYKTALVDDLSSYRKTSTTLRIKIEEGIFVLLLPQKVVIRMGANDAI